MDRSLRKWLFILALLLPTAAYGQNFAAPTSPVIDGTGHPVAGATVTVCAGALSLPPAGTVCSPATTIFSTFSGAAQANPFPTDGFGNWPFFATAGNYLVSISNGPLITYSFYITVGAGAVPSFNNTWTGSNIFNNAAGGGANDITDGVLNRIHMSCGNGSGYRFPTIEAGNSDILTNSTQGGYNFVCPDNLTDTFTSQNEIGSSTKIVVDDLHPGNVWTSNFATSATYLWGLHNGSAIVGAQNGTRGSTPGARTGGAYLYYPCNANTSYGLTTAEGISTIQGYGMLQHVNLEGCASGTVGAGSPSIALLNWEGISSFNTIEDDYIFGFANTVGCRFASNNVGGNGALLGPLVIKNVWCNGLNNTGAQPWKITTTASSCSSILPISVIGGVANDSGSSLPEFEVNGQGCNANTIDAGIVSGFHTENLNNALTPIHFKIVDTSNWLFEATQGHFASSGETGFDISQSLVGHTCNITTQNNFFDNSAATYINNHISGFSETGETLIPFYHFGGDSSCAIYPLVIDSNQLEIVKKSQPFLARNLLDAELDGYDCDSGLTATQNCVYRWKDRGTVEWGAFKDTSNNWFLQDVPHAFNRMVFFPNAQTEVNAGNSSNDVRINSRANSGTGGLSVYSGGASPALEVAIVGSGHINQGVTGTIAGTCSMGAGTTCTFSIGTAFSSSPICIATAQSAAASPPAGACSVSSTTVTITASASNSLTWGALLIGNPN